MPGVSTVLLQFVSSSIRLLCDLRLLVHGGAFGGGSTACGRPSSCLNLSAYPKTWGCTAQVMSTPHALNGQELAIDRATPKEKGPAGQAQLAARMSASQQSSGYSGGSRWLAVSGMPFLS